MKRNTFRIIDLCSDKLISNGRTGRIINVLYLVMNDLLDIPVLYMSRYIVQNKEAYYTHLQSVRDSDDWESWILYMLEGVRQTSKQTMKVIEEMSLFMEKQKHHLRDAYQYLL
ncbi:MAG: hypothetical protein OCC49_20085 [Fibrobacterales bacterium]